MKFISYDIMFNVFIHVVPCLLSAQVFNTTGLALYRPIHRKTERGDAVENSCAPFPIYAL
jgi:hypothetical protein